MNSDGTDDAVLRSENIGSTDRFIAVTGIDKENLMSSLIGERLGVKKVITKIGRKIILIF
ncbi:NAD-binding protein [Clostridium thermarum]|uniref:NAD-binding protein n=1 Tax=Clostridium thermarum TaxID=1716543 RepID=UPI003C2F736C